MKDLKELIDSLHLDTQLHAEEIPDIDLYMDQVIQLFERKFAKTKRTEEEKILTKTMINNYAKGKLFFPIKNKKYTKEHVMLISMIYQMKSILSISDIKISLDPLNEKVMEHDIDLEQFYEKYIQFAEKNVEHFIENVQHVNGLVEEEQQELRQLLFVATFTHMSSLYRRAAEKLIDDIEAKTEKS